MKKTYYIIAAVSCLVAIIIELTGVFNFIELKSLDIRYNLRADLLHEPKTSKEIVVIGVDDLSIAKIKEPFILWDTYFAKVIEHVGQHKAKVIGLDLIWAKRIDDFVTRSKKDKNALRRALLITKNKYKTPIVMGIGAASRKKGQANIEIDTSLPMKYFGSIVGRSGFGVVNTIPGDDNFVRHYKLNYESMTGQEVSLPGFANRISAYYLDKKPLEQNTVKTINYQLNKTIPIVPFYEVIDAIDNNKNEDLTKWFKDKIVLIGVTNVSGDILPTPIAQETPGILIHAHAIDMIIHNNDLTKSPTILFVLMSMIISFIVVYYSSKLSLKASITLLLIIFLIFSIANLLLFDANILFPYSSIVIMMVFAYGDTYFYRFIIEEKSKKRLATFFKSYVNDQVVKDILNSDAPMELEGKRTKVCVLFCDIRSFTTYSEANPSEEVFRTLNEYFSEMTDAILNNNGTVDKFIGDGLMAFFGAPISIENPTLSAVKASLDMRARLAKLNEKWTAEGRQALDNGIGLHTGYAHIGNVGSDKKMDYTAIGDTVNIASRVEGVTKNLKSAILITHECQELVHNDIVSIPKGEVPLKGRAPVFVYEVTNLKVPTA
ncbi:MAG: adenylate/guanylate cyclase domain-containing protein [Gammaproteobacteria bacterium]|nr:adenylate/guanylate cyclase domain-containing protein [Gammaproteobacteria bacterium]